MRVVLYYTLMQMSLMIYVYDDSFVLYAKLITHPCNTGLAQNERKIGGKWSENNRKIGEKLVESVDMWVEK